jgi:hypothetical protein
MGLVYSVTQGRRDQREGHRHTAVQSHDPGRGGTSGSGAFDPADALSSQAARQVLLALLRNRQRVCAGMPHSHLGAKNLMPSFQPLWVVLSPISGSQESVPRFGDSTRFKLQPSGGDPGELLHKSNPLHKKNSIYIESSNILMRIERNVIMQRSILRNTR